MNPLFQVEYFDTGALLQKDPNESSDRVFGESSENYLLL